jgi:hypothetical protein
MNCWRFGRASIVATANPSLCALGKRIRPRLPHVKEARSRRTWPWLPLAGIVTILLWFGFISLTTARGLPVCFSELRIASARAVLRQGAWSYLQAERPKVLAAQGVEGQSYNPTRPIDIERVDQFLLAHPNCCVIHPAAVSESQPWRLLVQLFSHNLAYVEVKVRPTRPIDYMDTYLIDARGLQSLTGLAACRSKRRRQWSASHYTPRSSSHASIR